PPVPPPVQPAAAPCPPSCHRVRRHGEPERHPCADRTRESFRRLGHVTDYAPALLTDHCELTMLSAALRDGTAGRHCVFEVFARRLPTGRRYGVVAGAGRIVEQLADLRFRPDEVDFLRERGVVDDATAGWLAEYRFTGDIDGYPEGELFFPGSPILTVSGTFAECVVLETFVLSVLNHDCAVAAAAARMVTAARG